MTQMLFSLTNYCTPKRFVAKRTLKTGWEVAAASAIKTFEDTRFQVLVRHDGRIYFTCEDDITQTWLSPQPLFENLCADDTQTPQLTVLGNKLKLTFTDTNGQIQTAYMDKYQAWKLSSNIK